MRLPWRAWICAGALLLCASPGRTASVSDAPSTVTIAYQPGLGYATFIVLKAQRALERAYPGTAFDWRVLSNGATIRDGFVAGQIQIGAGGAAPFLIGWDRGVGYRLIAALNEFNLWCVTRDPKIESIKDMRAERKIGVPAPDSIQAIVLRKAAQDQLGNAHAFDGEFVAIQHPLGVVGALAGGQLDVHCSAPPFQADEVSHGGHVVYKSYDAFGKVTFNSAYTTDAFARAHPAFVAGFAKALGDATAFIKAQPDQAAQLIAQDGEMHESAAGVRPWLSGADTTFTTVPHGYLRIARFMQSIGLLTRVPASIDEITLPSSPRGGD